MPNKNFPTQINYHQKSKRLDVVFSGAESFKFSAEFLRVYSPSAEVRGHGEAKDENLPLSKQDVTIDKIEPVGNYAIRLIFSDGHDSGIYSWDLLLNYGVNQNQMWQQYQEKVSSLSTSD